MATLTGEKGTGHIMGLAPNATQAAMASNRILSARETKVSPFPTPFLVTSPNIMQAPSARTSSSACATRPCCCSTRSPAAWTQRVRRSCRRRWSARRAGAPPSRGAPPGHGAARRCHPCASGRQGGGVGCACGAVGPEGDVLVHGRSLGTGDARAHTSAGFLFICLCSRLAVPGHAFGP